MIQTLPGYTKMNECHSLTICRHIVCREMVPSLLILGSATLMPHSHGYLLVVSR